MAQFALLVTHRDIIGRAPQLSELQSLLEKYKRQEVIFLIAKLNAVLRTWENAPNFELDEQVSRIFLSKHIDRLSQLRRENTTRVVFSRMTLLYLVKQACLVSPQDGEMLNSNDSVADIGVAALMANDLMLPFVPSDRDGTLERISNLLPFYDYISKDGYATEIARGDEMFDLASQMPSLQARRDFVDVSGRFEEIFGLNYQTFCQLVFGCATKFLNPSVKDLWSPNAFVLTEAFFQKSTIHPEKAREFFNRFAVSEADLAI